MCDKSNELIKKLVLNFFKCLHIDLKPEDIKLMTWANQEAFLNQTINSSLFKKYPINLNFCRLFFKRLIQTLDQEDQEVHDDMYTFICSTMKNCDENGFNYHHYVINNNLSNVITIKETRNMVINGTTGLKTWEAALMLSDWSLCNKQLFSNKKILELGSGVGFTGITIAKHCQIKSIIMSDCHAEVLKTINDNIQINFPNAIAEERSYATMYKSDTKMIGTLMLDWNEINYLSTCLIPDIIIGADIVYDPSILQALLNVFELFYKRNDNINIYIASVIRNKDTFNKFVKILDSSNFKHKQLCLMKNSFIDWDVNIDKCLLKITKDYIFNVLISYL